MIYNSETTSSQKSVIDSLNFNNNSKLSLEIHQKYLLSKLTSSLSSSFISLDSSKPWIIYWLVHSLDLLSFEFPLALKTRILNTISSYQSSAGGFSGNTHSLPHLAPTFASVHTLAILNSLHLINRDSLYAFLLSLKLPNGSFQIHALGESDTRSSYCAISVASLTNLLTDTLTSNVDDYIINCQSYEGGLGGNPGNEAHGGYTYCGIATLFILNKLSHKKLNMDALLHWSASRQMSFEGGFQGRTNKLVDGCYAFWLGAINSMLEIFSTLKSNAPTNNNDSVPKNIIENYDKTKLQQYLIFFCQEDSGGLRDKPGKRPDFYHTCYCLSGLSIAQHYYYYDYQNNLQLHPKLLVFGPTENLLNPVHPAYNIRFEKVAEILEKNNN